MAVVPSPFNAAGICCPTRESAIRVGATDIVTPGIVAASAEALDGEMTTVVAIKKTAVMTA